jgi:putative transposase
LLRANLEDCNVRILAFCLMSNHVHWIIVPGTEDSLARFFRRVHGRYAQYLNARRQRNGQLWQNRFYSCPLGETHLWTALRYVELNPVRAGLVEAPHRYRWSSAASHWGGMDPFGIVDMAYWQSQGGAERWHPLLIASEDYVSLRLLRACTYAGRPLGDENFPDAIRRTFSTPVEGASQPVARRSPIGSRWNYIERNLI